MSLDRTMRMLGDGEVVRLPSGELIFKLDSYEKNPVVRPQDIGLTWLEDDRQQIGAVFNGGAAVYRGRMILAPRCHRGYRRVEYLDRRLGIRRHGFENYISEVWILASDDGVKFERFHDVVIRGDGTDHKDFIYGIEDIRIVEHDHRYLMVGCGKIKPPFKGENSDRIAVYSTEDFIDIAYHGIIRCFDSRNAVPFFDDDRSYILLRFYPNIHLAVLEEGMEQLLNPSRYEKYWMDIYDRKDENLLLEAGKYPHEKEKIGPSTQLIRTDHGWLFIYHAVGEIGVDICRGYGLTEGIERGYSICAALLDIDNPKDVICRTDKPIYIPSKPYELFGSEQYPVDMPSVVFPIGAVLRNDKLLIYCGAGDKYVTLLSCSLSNLVDYLLYNCRLS